MFKLKAAPGFVIKIRGKGAAYMFMFTVLFFSSFELYITMYLGKFTLPRIPSHDDITLFLAH